MRASDDAEAQVEGYLEFMRAHPNVSNDLTNPSLMGSVDYGILSEKIAESDYLQLNCTSLDWLIRNYRKIIRDHYKTHKPPVSPVIGSGKSNLRLWQEFRKAILHAKEDWGGCPLYRMLDEEAKQEMGELYKGLSPEIRDYCDPTSFLELCGMEEEEMKYERGRFLKAIGSIREKLKSEAVNG